MSKVLIMLADGFETLEALSVKDVCVRVGIECDLCGVTSRIVESAHGIRVDSDILLQDANLDYDAIVIPGGMPGSTNLRDNDTVVGLIKSYYDEGKLVASICAGPIALDKAGILDGKNVTSYPGALSNAKNINYLEDVVVRDSNIITSRGPATALEFSYEIVKYLGEGDNANTIRKGMLVEYYLEENR